MIEALELERNRIMAYQATPLNICIRIDRIISLHYFEYTSDFCFPGEAHDFWEFVFLDSGRIDLVAGTDRFPLKQGHLFLHRPNEFHNVVTDGVSAPNLVVVSFECTSPILIELAGRQLPVFPDERRFIAQLVDEGKRSFLGRMDDPWQQALVKRSTPLSFASEQMIQLLLEMLLISLYRRSFSRFWELTLTEPPLSLSSDPDFHRITRYLKYHISDNLRVSQICRENLISESSLKKLVKRCAGCGIIEYFIRLKIEAAKKLIRERRYNYSEIADQLGFSSVHYFCRQFKHHTHMTPSEYRNSVQSL